MFSHHNHSKVTEPDFWKNPNLGARVSFLAHFEHKNWLFLKYLKNASLVFFYFRFDFRSNWDLQNGSYVNIPKTLVCRWCKIKRSFFYRFRHIWRTFFAIFLVFCLIVIDNKILRFLPRVYNFDPYWAWLWSQKVKVLLS